MTARLIFIRHGETDWNVAGRMQGHKDIPLNGRGRDQAGAVGRTLKTALGPSLPTLPWLVSPLLRTRDTAEIARTALGLTPKDYATDDRLRELTFGDWEGLTWADVRKQAPSGFTARVDDPWGATPPNGESYADVAERIRGWLATVTGEAIVVSHGGIARVLMVLIGGLGARPRPSCRYLARSAADVRGSEFQLGRMIWHRDRSGSFAVR